MNKDHARKVCKLGAGSATCAFLAFGSGWECLKGTYLEQTIRDRLASDSMVARGDNCPGFQEEPVQSKGE